MNITGKHQMLLTSLREIKNMFRHLLNEALQYTEDNDVINATKFQDSKRCRVCLIQVPGEGKSGGAAVHHPESNEGQQPEGLHAKRGSPCCGHQQGENVDQLFCPTMDAGNVWHFW